MGREFMDIFDEWADSYEDAVHGLNIEYQKVFEHYEAILQTIASKAKGLTVEFGVGTGNLIHKLHSNQVEVIGVEPNHRMRTIAQTRFPELKILDGDLLKFPKIEGVQTIVSSYAFHHLTDAEKQEAFHIYYDWLPEDGQIVFADTFFKSDLEYEKAIQFAEQQVFHNLSADLEREYYTTLPTIERIAEQAQFTLDVQQLNDFVWLIHAKKK